MRDYLRAAAERAADARGVRARVHGGRPAADAGRRRGRRCRSASETVEHLGASDRVPRSRDELHRRRRTWSACRPARSVRASTTSGSPSACSSPARRGRMRGCSAPRMPSSRPLRPSRRAGRRSDDAQRSAMQGGHDAVEGALPLRRHAVGRLRRRDALERHVQAAHAEPALARRLRHPRRHPAHPRAARRGTSIPATFMVPGQVDRRASRRVPRRSRALRRRGRLPRLLPRERARASRSTRSAS